MIFGSDQKTLIVHIFPNQGPTPGMISLTVARRIDHNRERSSPSSANRSGRESANSLLTNSSGTETLGGAKSAPTTPIPDHFGTTDASDANTFHINKVNTVARLLTPHRWYGGRVKWWGCWHES